MATYNTKSEVNIARRVDWVMIILYVVMITYGWVSIYGASYDHVGDGSGFLDIPSRARMQLIWMGVSLLVGFAIFKIDSHFFDQFAYVFYVGFMLLLIVTFFIAPDVKGSRSWLVLGPVSIQPAELAKISVALALARFMSGHHFRLMSSKNLLFVLMLILLPILLIIMQRETGSALVYIAFILVLYREGLPGMVLYLGGGAILLFVVGLKYSDVELGYITLGELLCMLVTVFLLVGLLIGYTQSRKEALHITLATIFLMGGGVLLDKIFGVSIPYDWLAIALFIGVLVYLLYIGFATIRKKYFGFVGIALGALLFSTSVSFVFTDVLQPHQQQRIKVSLGMEDDLRGVGYNVNQSKIAIGSGGILGKGFLNGTQTKLKYVPEQDTDFIFCTVGEEQGFMGSVVVLMLFLFFILRLMYLAERQKLTFSRVFGYCVAAIFIFHVAINIGMVIGITPVIGIPLPFFSYGGSSLLGFTVLLFVFLRLDMARKR